MRRLTPCLLLHLLLLPAAPALAEERDPAAFLAEARARHLDQTARGLESFSVRMVLRRSEDENLRRFKEYAGFGYSWAAPETEEFDFAETHESLRKPLREVLQGMWRDITGAVCFDLLGKATDLRLEEQGGQTVATATLGEFGGLRAVFEADLTLAEVEFVKLDAKYTYLYDERPGGLRVARREVSRGGARLWRLTWGVFRKTSGFDLPTVVELETDKNTTEYTIAYGAVNGVAAKTAKVDEAEVKARVAEFEKGWRKWEEHRKVREMRSLAELPGDRVAIAIAKRGLRDRSPEVRAQAAEILGVMKRTCVVPALIASMKKNDKVIEVYLRLIQALGEIGDPRAVDILSKDWWNQRVGENGVAAAKAKIHALGNIRHVLAVDALIETFYVTKDETVNLFKVDLILSLRKLTGQDFKADRRAWKDWWKKNRSSHSFD